MVLQYVGPRWQVLDFQILADPPETINFKLKFQSKLMISDPGAPGADFEDLTALSETLKINIFLFLLHRATSSVHTASTTPRFPT